MVLLLLLLVVVVARLGCQSQGQWEAHLMLLQQQQLPCLLQT
jgi:hypothetical protein